MWNYVRRWVAETVSSLAINAFVFYLEVGLETPQKRTETRGKKFLKKTSFQVRAGPVKRTETRQGWENSRTLPTTEWCRPPLWPPTQCTCIPSSLCCVQSELGMQVHCVGGQRGGRHHSVVGSVIEFSHPCLVSVLFTGPSLTWNEVFSETFFP